MTGAQAVVKAMEEQKVKTVFGYPGAAICPLYNALIDSGITHVLTRHEQGAAHAANGYARATGLTGVCIATSGPGATNLITGLATAHMDSIPLVAITGQVATNLIGRDVFQEADITGAAMPFCKHSYLVKNAGDLPRIIAEAFHIASTGRPGPVLIDLPVDVQNQETDYMRPESINIRGYKPTYKGSRMQAKKIAGILNKAERPVICAGGGIISSGSSGEMLKLADMLGIPVVTTLMGIGSIPSAHKLCMGMLGSHGTKAANSAINKADLLLILGARVGDRSMSSTAQIAAKATIVHVDIDPAEIGKNINVDIPVVGDLKNVLKDIISILDDSRDSTTEDAAKAWREELFKIKASSGPEEKYLATNKKSVNPKRFINMLSGMVPEDTVITTEVGQNQIWAANHYSISRPRTFITSGGLGTMGYGLPASIGAAEALPGKTVINISGDGSFQMSLQELGTIKQHKTAVKIIIFNNSRLGMVRELQACKYEGRCTQVFLDDNPDFMMLAEAYGISHFRLDNDEGAKDAISNMLAKKGPFLLECIVDPEEPTL